jgi:hypothetical protein
MPAGNGPVQHYDPTVGRRAGRKRQIAAIIVGGIAGWLAEQFMKN